MLINSIAMQVEITCVITTQSAPNRETDLPFHIPSSCWRKQHYLGALPSLYFDLNSAPYSVKETVEKSMWGKIGAMLISMVSLTMPESFQPFIAILSITS